MRKTVEKEIKKEEEVKQEFKLIEAFAMWKNESKAGTPYLKGIDFKKNKLVGFFNSNKKNPKEPDVRIYEVDADGKQGNEVASLWDNVGKKGNYLTGMTDEKEKIVGFYNKTEDEKRPYVRVYFREEE